jgi:hypothetical protein
MAGSLAEGLGLAAGAAEPALGAELSGDEAFCEQPVAIIVRTSSRRTTGAMSLLIIVSPKVWVRIV